MQATFFYLSIVILIITQRVKISSILANFLQLFYLCSFIFVSFVAILGFFCAQQPALLSYHGCLSLLHPFGKSAVERSGRTQKSEARLSQSGFALLVLQDIPFSVVEQTGKGVPDSCEHIADTFPKACALCSLCGLLIFFAGVFLNLLRAKNHLNALRSLVFT